ncbi:hypothetical protein Tco_0152521 [Tanacetum coccineum]
MVNLISCILSNEDGWKQEADLAGPLLGGLFKRVLNRLTYVSTLSHLRRVNSPIGREALRCKMFLFKQENWQSHGSCITHNVPAELLKDSMLEVELDVDGMDKNSLLKLADASCADADVDASCADADAFCADANASLLLMLADAYTSCCSC